MIEALRKKIGLFSENESSIESRTLLKLFDAALGAAVDGNYPVAAAIINPQGEMVSLSTNQYFYPRHNSGAHAEIGALDDFEGNERGDLSACTLISTLEPCLMCTSRIVLSGVKRVRYLLEDPAGGGIKAMKVAPDDFRLLAERISFEKVEGGFLAQEIAQGLYVLGEKIWKDHYHL